MSNDSQWDVSPLPEMQMMDGSSANALVSCTKAIPSLCIQTINTHNMMTHDLLKSEHDGEGDIPSDPVPYQITTDNDTETDTENAMDSEMESDIKSVEPLPLDLDPNSMDLNLSFLSTPSTPTVYTVTASRPQSVVLLFDGNRYDLDNDAVWNSVNVITEVPLYLDPMDDPKNPNRRRLWWGKKKKKKAAARRRREAQARARRRAAARRRRAQRHSQRLRLMKRQIDVLRKRRPRTTIKYRRGSRGPRGHRGFRGKQGRRGSIGRRGRRGRRGRSGVPLVNRLFRGILGAIPRMAVHGGSGGNGGGGNGGGRCMNTMCGSMGMGMNPMMMGMGGMGMGGMGMMNPMMMMMMQRMMG